MQPTKPAAQMTLGELAAYIDHSVLKPDFTPDQVRREVANGVRYGCKTVCINPASIEIAKPLCEGTDTGICVVADFPFGASSTRSRVAQTRIVLEPTVATVRCGNAAPRPGSRAAGLAMALKLFESAQARWRAVNAPHLVALVRAGARLQKDQLVERAAESSSDHQAT